MNTQRICFLREVLVRDAKGRDKMIIEFSYENGKQREAPFFEVPDAELLQAQVLYAAWGGIRPAGYRRGTTVKRPWVSLIQSKSMWRQNGDH